MPVSSGDPPLLFRSDILWHLPHPDAPALFSQPDSLGCISAIPCNRKETVLVQGTGILPCFLFPQTPDNDVLHLETQLQNPLHPYGTIPVPLQVLFLHPLHTLLLLPHVDAAAHVLASSTPQILLYFCFHIPIALTSNSFYLYSLFLHSPSCFHYSSDQIHGRSQQNHHQYRYHTNFTSGYNTDTHIPITITTISIW